MHRLPTQQSCGLMEMLSGLWHHEHFKVHPLKKTVVRIPGPSSVDIRTISRTVASLLFIYKIYLSLACNKLINKLLMFFSNYGLPQEASILLQDKAQPDEKAEHTISM